MGLKFKIEDKIFDLDEIDVIDLRHEHTPAATMDNLRPEPVEVVRFSMRNRQEKPIMKDGHVVEYSHGVYQLPEDVSEKFRWFIEQFGPRRLGIMDVDVLYKDKERVEKIFKMMDDENMKRIQGQNTDENYKERSRKA